MGIPGATEGVRGFRPLPPLWVPLCLGSSRLTGCPSCLQGCPQRHADHCGPATLLPAAALPGHRERQCLCGAAAGLPHAGGPGHQLGRCAAPVSPRPLVPSGWTQPTPFRPSDASGAYHFSPGKSVGTGGQTLSTPQPVPQTENLVLQSISTLAPKGVLGVLVIPFKGEEKEAHKDRVTMLLSARCSWHQYRPFQSLGAPPQGGQGPDFPGRMGSFR